MIEEGQRTGPQENGGNPTDLSKGAKGVTCAYSFGQTSFGFWIEEDLIVLTRFDEMGDQRHDD